MLETSVNPLAGGREYERVIWMDQTFANGSQVFNESVLWLTHAYNGILVLWWILQEQTW